MSEGEIGPEEMSRDPFPTENSGGGNKEPPILPVVIADPNPEDQPKQRARSGFSRPGYWDEPNKDDPTLTNRQAKSIWAKNAAEEGLIGGARPGAGRPRKNKSVAEIVTENADGGTISRELNSMVKHKSPAIQLGAIDRINKFEQDLEKNMRDDEKELRKLTGPALDERLAEVLSEYGVGYDIDLPASDVEEVD